MPAVYSSVNAIQSTAWAINGKVLDTLEEITRRGGAMAGIPSMDVLPSVTRPASIDTDEEALLAWKKAESKRHEEEYQRKLAAREFHRVVRVAGQFREESAIYFPHNLDFRGRVYPLANYLNPQGDDLSKSLLTFAEGKPLGRKGGFYLAVHGANCLGKVNGVKVSRMSLQERAGIITAASEMIRQVAADPFVNRWWMDADEPLQFLAFCFEWAGYAEARAEGKGMEFVSHLPVSFDGTCNGLQHYAALLRDQEGAEAVNVASNEKPSDVYQRVADVVAQTLADIAVDVSAERAEPSQVSRAKLARLWLSSGLVDRSLAKRPTMTFAYGSGEYGFNEQLRAWLTKDTDYKKTKAHFTAPVVDEKGVVGEKVVVPQACAMMAGICMDALEIVVSKAAEGRLWMQKAARAVVKNGACVEWTVPSTGFPVRQEKFKTTVKRIETKLAGKVYKPQVNLPTHEPDPITQANGVAPNFIHSLDAAALQMTVSRSAGQGVSAFAMVHDSYGTHAADAETLSRVLRESFVSLYTETDVLSYLDATLRAQAGEDAKFPARPELGSLDLSEVLTSSYFFC